MSYFPSIYLIVLRQNRNAYAANVSISSCVLGNPLIYIVSWGPGAACIKAVRPTSGVRSGVHSSPVAPVWALRTSDAAQAWKQRLMGWWPRRTVEEASRNCNVWRVIILGTTPSRSGRTSRLFTPDVVNDRCKGRAYAQLLCHRPLQSGQIGENRRLLAAVFVVATPPQKRLRGYYALEARANFLVLIKDRNLVDKKRRLNREILRKNRRNSEQFQSIVTFIMAARSCEDRKFQ